MKTPIPNPINNIRSRSQAILPRFLFVVLLAFALFSFNKAKATTVSITSPSTGTVVAPGATFTISANASTTCLLGDYVVFSDQFGDSYTGTNTLLTNTWTYTWTTPTTPGQYTYYAQAFDNVCGGSSTKVSITIDVYNTYDWVGTAASNAWNTPKNWLLNGASQSTSGSYPGQNYSTDIANFGVNYNFSKSTYQPVVTATPPYSIGSIYFGYNEGTQSSYTFGTYQSMLLTVNSGYTLTVAGNITQNHNPSATGSSYNYINTVIAGAGTVDCKGNLLVGDASTQPATNVADVTQLTSTITQLTVEGNILLNSNGDGGNNHDMCYPWFSLQGGTTTLLGQVKFATNNSPVSGGFNYDNGFGSTVATFWTGYGMFTADYSGSASSTTTAASTLELKYKTPIVPADLFYVYFTDGGNLGTVLYDDPNSESQTIYTANEPSVTTTTTYIATNNPAYYNLTLSGTSTKTIDKNSTLGTTTQGLTVGKNFTTSGGNVYFNTNNPTTTITGTWTNSCTADLGSGSVTMGGFTSNTGGTLQCSSGTVTTNGAFQISAGTVNASSGTITMNGQFTNSAGALNCSSGSIYFEGGYQNSSGTFKAGSGMVYFQNTQTLLDNSTTGTEFKNVTFNGGTSSGNYVYTMSSGTGNFAVSPTGTLTMATYATLAAGSSSASYLTLLSGSTGTASVPAIPSSSSITGYVNVQRFITGNNSTSYRGYRLLSVPVNGNSITAGSTNYINFNDLNKQITLQGTTYYGVFTAGSGTGFNYHNANPVIYLYDEALEPTSATTANQSFISGKNVGISSISGTVVTLTSTFSTVNGTTPHVPVGNGFILFYIGSTNGRPTSGNPETINPDSAQITYSGYLNQQSVKTYLWYSPTGGSAGNLSYTTTSVTANFQGGNMVGNPYSATIDLDSVYYDNKTSITGAFYELNNPGQTYVSYNAKSHTVSGTNAGAYIASGQGFLVVANTTGQTLTFSENEKVSQQLTGSSSPATMLAALPPANVLTGLHLQLTKDSMNTVQTGIYFNKAWSDRYNPEEDAVALDGMSPKVFLSSYSSDARRLCINQLSSYTQGKRIKLFVKVTTDGIYKLQLADILNIDTANYQVYLIDNKLNDSLDMVHYKSYTFNFYTADTASFANRFVLAIERRAMPPYQLLTFEGQKQNNFIQLNWKTTNEGNYTGFGLQKLGTNGLYATIDTAQSTNSGIYSFNDPSPVDGSNIYRLEQNDINGKVTFAGPININYSATSANGAFTVYPNPAKSIINVNLNSAVLSNTQSQSYLVKIYSLAGTLMDSRSENANNWTEDVSAYKGGIYILEIYADGYSIGKAKFLKTN